MTQFIWEAYTYQSDAIAATEGVGIAAILFGETLTKGDLGWLLVDGRKVEYHKGEGGGCDTCGYGGDEDTWYVATPKNFSDQDIL